MIGSMNGAYQEQKEPATTAKHSLSATLSLAETGINDPG